jgi:hypothetical protein
MMTLLKEDDVVYKALTILAIEKTLLDVGKPTYEKVVSTLNKEYHCYLADCYEHPEYLIQVLRKLFGNSQSAIVESIKKQLEEYSFKKPVERFLTIISQ